MITLGFDWRIAEHAGRIRDSWTPEQLLERSMVTGAIRRQGIQRCHLKIDHDFIRFPNGIVRIMYREDHES